MNRSGSELSELAALLSASQSNTCSMEELVSDWKEECRFIAHKGRAQEYYYEAEMATMKTKLLSLSQALLASRLRAKSGTDEALSSTCQALEKERVELKSSVAEFERQLASAKRELHSFFNKRLDIKCRYLCSKPDPAETLKKREE